MSPPSRFWTAEHEALRNALAASSTIPTLYRRLSLERYMPDADEVRRLRDWATSLCGDPAWSVIEPVLQRPAAWPDVWVTATQAGFSPRTDHHHALLFGRFCDSFLESSDFEGARWTWTECIAAWARVFRTTYPGGLFDAVAPDLGSSDAPGREELLRSMLDVVVVPRVEDLRRAAGLAAPAEVPAVHRRPLRFAHRALEIVLAVDASVDPYGTLEQMRRAAATGLGTVNAQVLQRFEAIGEAEDLSEITAEGLVRRFHWVTEYFDVVGKTEGAVTTIVEAAVETGWKLRRLDRDDVTEASGLFSLVRAFNEDLAARLRSFESAFGHNAACADFFVFLAEKEKDTERKLAILEEAREVCPGHRNSAMLIAWELVGQAQTIMVQLSLTPTLIARVSGGSSKESLVRAKQLCDEAEAMYAFNKELPELREKIRNEAQRLGVTLEDDSSD